MLHKTILRVRDENGLGDIYNELELRFDRLSVTVEDIITERVYQEVARYNNKAEGYKHPLVRSSDEETLLNNTRNKTKRRVNAEKQVEVALKAFAGNGFFILVDDMQVEDLRHVVTVSPDTVISFVRLTPLVGG